MAKKKIQERSAKPAPSSVERSREFVVWAYRREQQLWSPLPNCYWLTYGEACDFAEHVVASGLVSAADIAVVEVRK